MPEYKMTDEYQKILTEMIGEEIKPDVEYHCYGKVRETGETNNCHNVIEGSRTFDDDSDMMKVFRCLVGNRKCGIFIDWVSRKTTHYKECNCFREWCQFFAWLFYDPERFCCLVAMAKKEGVI